MKLAFYVISEALERVALDSIQGRDDRESLKRDLDPARFKQIEDAYKRTGDAARSLVSYLNIADLLRLAAKADAIHIEEDVLKVIKDVRDASAHPSNNLISNYSDVKKLADVKRECACLEQCSKSLRSSGIEVVSLKILESLVSKRLVTKRGIARK